MKRIRRTWFHPRNRCRHPLAVATVFAIALAAAAQPGMAGVPVFSGSHATPYPTGAGSSAVAMGDLDGDGDLDVVTENYYAGSLSVLLGAGDGTLHPAGDYPTGAGARKVTLARLNDDGLPDVAVVNPDAGTLSILFSTVHGTLQAAAVLPQADWWIGDVDGDGMADLFAFRDTSVHVRFNLGGGAFAAPQVWPGLSRWYPYASGDFNVDGRVDLLVRQYRHVEGEEGEEVFAVMLGNGDGSFAPPADVWGYIDDETGFFGAAIGEVNGDGLPDLAFFTADCFRGCTESAWGPVLLGNGDGTFRGAGGAVIYGQQPSFIDLDGDGRGELLSRYGGGVFVSRNPPAVAAWNVGDFAVGDLNGDGRADMVTVDAGTPSRHGGDHAWVLIGNGDGTFGPPASRALSFNPGPVASGDLNGDGRTDLVAAHTGAGGDFVDSAAQVLLDDGAGGFIPGVPFQVGDGPGALALGDLNEDGRLDLAVVADGETSVLLGDGSGSFGSRTVVTNWTGSLAVGDLDGDHHLDLVFGAWTAVAVFPGNGDGTFGTERMYPPGAGGGRVVIEDVNRDGRPDLVLARGGVVSTLLGGPTGLGPPIDSPAVAATDVATGDLNGDGNPDLVTTGGRLSTMLGDGAGRFAPADDLELTGLRTPALGDLNGDGNLDLAVAGGETRVAVILGAGDGTLGTVHSYSTGGTSPWWVGTDDRNGDFRPDLTITSAGVVRSAEYPGDGSLYSGFGGAVDVFLNQGAAPGDSFPALPMPTFTTAQPGHPASIYLGQTFNVTFGVRNLGYGSDDGRISVSFPSLTDPADTLRVTASAANDAPGLVETPAGGALTDLHCDPIIASYLAMEYADANWNPSGIETNTLTLTVQPREVGAFTFLVRSTMHRAGGGACEFVNGLPLTGEAGDTDQQGWAVKRYSLVVLPAPVLPAPVFTTAVGIAGDSLALGETFTISVSVRNDAAASNDGRIVVGFPSFASTADSQFVSSASTGDSPGYRELPAGTLVTDSLCQSGPAPYLIAEYADASWPWLGTETNTLNLTVRPNAVGTFVFEVRSTMHVTGGAGCEAVNVAPAGGIGPVTDPQGWSVQRFAMTVLPPKPQPTFTDAVTPAPAATITLGYSFTLTTTVVNAGSDTDDGRIVVSFPNLTPLTAAQWVSATSSGDDVPGYREWPRGSVLQLPGCPGIVADYLSVEYADDAWSGGGSETNQLSLTVTPQATGPFPILFRSTMRWAQGGPCAYVDGLPANLATSGDQQGRPVGVMWVQVVPPAPPPYFTSVAGIPRSIVLGESFTVTAALRNDGPLTDDGRISFGFPNLTRPADSGRVLIGQADDLPGSAIRVAGTALWDSACRTVNADHLVAEYTDSSWATGEINTFFVTVQPESSGTFYVDVRAIVHDVAFSGGSCRYANALPPGGSPVTDPQGWTVRRFAVTVYGPEGPLPPPSIAWEPMVVPAGGPSPRGGAAAVYRPGGHSMVIYGGQSPAYTGDVWSLPLGDGGAWSQISPGGPAPLRRIMHSMILNPIDDQLVVFGGLYDFFLNDVQVMTLGGNPWWFPNPGHGTPPSARGGHVAVYDSLRDRMLVIGGFGTALLNDVWEYSPPGVGTWRQLTPAGSPMPPRAQAAAVYDPLRDRVIVFGGDGGLFLNDVWALNLSGEPAWEELHPTGSPPSPRREHTAIYDPVGDRVIVHGGFDLDRVRRGDVWALDLSGTPSWHLLVSSTPPPTARSGHVAIYDTQSRRMVMFGGQIGTNQYSNEVWSLNLDTATPVAVSLVSIEARPDRVRITWSAEGAANLRTTVERTQAGAEEWLEVGRPEADGKDRLVFEDRTVVPGRRYGFRLVVHESGRATAAEPAWVTVPLPAVLALAGPSPNPSQRGVTVRFSLPGSDAATLELFDLNGRRVASREVGSLGAGEHRVPLSDPPSLPAGVYLIRLTQGARMLTAKACVVK